MSTLQIVILTYYIYNIYAIYRISKLKVVQHMHNIHTIALTFFFLNNGFPYRVTCYSKNYYYILFTY